MIQNFFELWYWIVVLAIMAGTVGYFVVCYLQNLWQTFKARLDDVEPTVFAESIAQPYSKRIVMIHWLTLALLILAWYLGDTLVGEREARSVTMTGYLVHALVGGTVLVVTAMRMVYHGVDRAPPLVSNTLLDMLAREVHRMLYLLLMLMPLTGFMTLLTSDVGMALATIDAMKLPEKYTGSAAISKVVHDILMNVLIATVAIHVLGAIWHQFIKKDGLMRRMSLRRKGRAAP